MGTHVHMDSTTDGWVLLVILIMTWGIRYVTIGL